MDFATAQKVDFCNKTRGQEIPKIAQSGHTVQTTPDKKVSSCQWDQISE